MSWVIQIIIALIQAIVPEMFKRAKDTALDGQVDVETRNKLESDIEATWGKSK